MLGVAEEGGLVGHVEAGGDSGTLQAQPPVLFRKRGGAVQVGLALHWLPACPERASWPQDPEEVPGHRRFSDVGQTVCENDVSHDHSRVSAVKTTV